MPNFSALPEALRAAGESSFERLPAEYRDALGDHQSALCYAFALSDFIARVCQQYPTICRAMILQSDTITLSTAEALDKKLKTCQTEEQLFAALRQYRHHHMALIAYRDLCLDQDIEQSLHQVSLLAEQLICAAYDWLYKVFAERLGTPTYQGVPQPMQIIGMGKLGGRELNFSSDIDLIFCYPHTGTTEGGRKSVDNQTFFTRLGQKLIAALNQITEDGQVYRVDMRLRPLGSSGPLAIHHAALEDYYQSHGRHWERYAMVKARVLNPEPNFTPALYDIIRPFVYRRYIDYTSIDALRDMKRMIKQEVRRRGLVDNIKLGEGGIREAEFIVQSFQLIRAGRQKSLQTAAFADALNELYTQGVFRSEDYLSIKSQYLLLRKVEHCLQQFDDKQTQSLPSDVLGQQRLAIALSADSETYADQYAHINHAMAQIRCHFNVLIGEENHVSGESPHQEWVDVWRGEFNSDDWLAQLKPFNLSHPNEVIHQIEQAHQASYKRAVGERGALLVEHLYPLLIAEILHHGKGKSQAKIQGLLTSIFNILSAISGRTAYLDLLIENHGARQQMITLCGASPFIAEQLSRFPLLLDELINPSSLYEPIDHQQCAALLRQFMLRVDPDDLEWQMESLRQFKLSYQLKIAAMDVAGALSVMEVSDHLTFLAESILAFSIEIAWQQMTQKYGNPINTSEFDKGLLAVAYGKFGGIELSYGSDLDMVFLHQSERGTMTQGSRQIESAQFYQRLVQRIIHILHTVTHSGKLYEIDLRLRPQGGSGLLICHVQGFDKYQNEDAWTWEHQALTRTRCVYGSDSLMTRFNGIRHSILCRSREPEQLVNDVVSMRQKMSDHLLKQGDIASQIKHGQGGIVAIEFLTQYWILRYSALYPELTQWSDNVRLLDQVAALGLISDEERQSLTEAYLWLRAQAHHVAIGREIDLSGAEYQKHRQEVIAIWQRHLIAEQSALD